MLAELPLKIGEWTTDADLAGDLGKIYFSNGRGYRLCKMTANLTSAVRQVVVTALSSGVPTWVVSATTTANLTTAVGLLAPDLFNGKTTLTGTAIASNGTDITASSTAPAFGLVQISGHSTGTSVAAVTVGVMLGTSTTTGQLDTASITAGVGSIGIATSVGGTGTLINVYLKGAF